MGGVVVDRRAGLPAMSFPLRPIAVAALLAVLALVAFSFARVVIVEYQLSLQKQALEREVADLKTENLCGLSFR